MKILIILLFVLSYAENITCNTYTCTSNEKDICYNQHENQVNLTVCNKGKICFMSDLHNTSEDISFPCKEYKAYAGEYCLTDDSCYTGKCDRVCKGRTQGDNCNDTKNCDSGFFCDSFKCVPVGESCTNSDQCLNYQGCYENKCVNYASKENNEKTDNFLLCKSFYQKGGICLESPELANNTNACPESNNCTYKNSTSEFNESCVCGKNDKGIKYCPQGVKSIDTEKVILMNILDSKVL